MAFDRDTLQSIYRTTRGFCHRCRRKLAFSRFASDDGRGAWDIDATCPHPRATALVPVCRHCLQDIPGRAPDRSARHDAPLAPAAAPGAPADTGRAEEGAGPEKSHGALIGGLFGALLGGLWGALLGGLVGAGFALRG